MAYSVGPDPAVRETDAADYTPGPANRRVVAQIS